MSVCFWPRVDATRLSKTFAVAQTGMQYLMCQIMFNRLFAAKDGASIDSVASQYDKHWSLLPWVSITCTEHGCVCVCVRVCATLGAHHVY